MEIKVKLDRITIVGEIYWKPEHMNKLIRNTNWEMIDCDSKECNLYRYFEDGSRELVAALLQNPHQQSYRLDTSNHLQSSDELEDIQTMISLFQKNTCHQTRIDIAFDFINGEIDGNILKPMSHRIYRFNASKSIYYADSNLDIFGRSQNIETIYSGKRKSGKMIRYYNKLAERKSHKKEVPSDIERWERLELQLRGKNTNDWINSAREMLNCFKLPKIKTVENIRDRSILSAIENGDLEWSELSKNYRTKLRKLIKNNNGFNTDYAYKALEVLENHKSDIVSEIQEFHKKLGIFEYSFENQEKLKAN